MTEKTHDHFKRNRKGIWQNAAPTRDKNSVSKENIRNLMKNHLRKTHSQSHTCEILNVFSVKLETKIIVLSTLFQCSTGGLTQCNKARKVI